MLILLRKLKIDTVKKLRVFSKLAIFERAVAKEHMIAPVISFQDIGPEAILFWLVAVNESLGKQFTVILRSDVRSIRRRSSQLQ